MPTLFRLTLLGTCAALGIGVAVAVAVQSKSPAGTATSWKSPLAWFQQQAVKSPEATTEPPADSTGETSAEPPASLPSGLSEGEPELPVASEYPSPAPRPVDEPASPPEVNQLQAADPPRLAPYRQPVVAQLDDLEASIQRATDAARRNEQVLSDTLTTLRQPPSEGPRIRSVPRGVPSEAGDDEALGAEALPTPKDPSGPTVAEIHKNEGDDSLSLHLQNSELRGVLKMLSDQGELNILASKSVQGTVSATLKNVDVLTALNAILQSTGFTSRREGNFVYVGTPQDFIDMDQLKDRIGTRIYRTNYVKAADLNVLITPMLTERVGKVTVSTPSEIDIAASTSKTGGNGFSNEEVIIVRDYEAVLAQVDQIVEEVDRRPQQVLIEAMILTVKLDDTNTMGVDLAALLNTNNARLFTGSPLASLGAIDVSKGGLKFGFLNGAAGAFVTALETVGDTNVVASPKLMCLNKQRAEILIGQQLGYISSTVTETSTTQAVQFLEVGTQLRIRPYISRDGMVRMEVHPELSTGNVRVVGAFTLPDKTVTQVTTNIMCRDGATVVIGGLIREDLGANINQVPWVGNLPWIGTLFRRKVENTSKNEIIVLLTPRIVSEPEVNIAASQEAGDFLQRQSVFADKMSPIGKRHYARTHFRLALAAWEAGNARAALRNINISVQFDPLSIDAIRLRNEITGSPNWTYNPPMADDLPSDWLPPVEAAAPPIMQGKTSTPAVKPARFEAPVAPGRGKRVKTSFEAMKPDSPFTSFNPEPTATERRLTLTVAVGSGLNEFVAIATLLLLTTTLGCATTKPQSRSLPKPSPTRSIVDTATTPTSKREQQQLVREFEERRDAAQLGAAVDRWNQGDEAGAEGLLAVLLARSPDHREARRTLADLYAARPNPSAALEHLLYLVEHDPADAQAHHSLGLLLQTLNRRSEALQHFEQALKLDPKNELYLLSRDACRES